MGSGTGITDFQAGTVDFAASDVPMAASDLAKVPASSGPVIQIPDILGGVTVSYNLPGVTKRLKLDAATLAGIFDGTIKTWNASQIKALNPGVTLPSNAIVPEVRADSSGTTYIFTDYLAVGRPDGVDARDQQDHRLAVGGRPDAEELGGGRRASSRPRTRSATSSWPTPSRTTSPSPPSRTPPACTWCPRRPRVAADADQKLSVTPTDFSIVNEPGATSYPIAGYSWAILLQKQTSATTGAQVVKVLDWTTHTGGGQDQAAGLDYVAAPARPPELEPDHAADGDRPERADAAHQVSARVRRPTGPRGADRTP